MVNRLVWFHVGLLLAACTGALDEESRSGNNAADTPLPEGEVPVWNGDNETPMGEQLGCKLEPPPALELSRLTRAQYAASIETLFGVRGFSLEGLPEDESPEGFARALSGLSTQAASSFFELSTEVAELVLEDPSRSLGCDSAVADCLDDQLVDLLTRAFRRPPATDVVQAYRTYFSDVRSEHGDIVAEQNLITAIIMSPEFLHHETRTLGDAEVAPLDAWSVASRISFMLLGTAPDEALLAAAADGTLLTDEGITREVERLLDAPSSQAGLARFASQWLGLGLFERQTSMGSSAAQSVRESLERSVVERLQSGTFSDLHTFSDYWVDAPMGEHLGVLVDGWQTQPIEGRAGVLEHPAVLAQHGTSNPVFTAIHRGVFVFEDIFCQELGTPPMNAASEPDRETNATCQACHRRIDPIGFAFADYDRQGRVTESPVESSYVPELIGTDVDGRFSTVAELSERVSGSNQAQGCFARAMLTHAMLQEPRSIEDACALERINDAVTASGGNLRTLILETVLSDRFRFETRTEEGSLE